jgi:hypothetical protein
VSVNVIGFISEAAGNDEMRADARVWLAEMLTDGDLMLKQKRVLGIRPSDYGSCVLQLWAENHGLLDLPRDPIDDTLSRLDAGSLLGAWEACLFKAAWVRSAPNRCAYLEYVPEGGGHIDVLALEDDVHVAVVEFKSQWSNGTTKPPEKDNPQHLLQSGDYATRPDVQTPELILVYLRPPNTAGKRMKQFTRDPEPYARLVVEERARLAPALLDEPPQYGDPQTRYACLTCRFSKCARNKNKQQNAAELLYA